jgi:hypothetical protein
MLENELNKLSDELLALKQRKEKAFREALEDDGVAYDEL